MGGRHADPGRDIFIAWAKAPLNSDAEYEVILVDATESPIECPKKAKAILFRKEKAAYAEGTAARQLADRVIALAFFNGKKHDFQLFKDYRFHVKAETELEADTC